jgi:hypothetical protein
MKDLVLLVADKDMKFALMGLLGWPQALGIRAISFEVLVHAHHDPGCRKDAHNLLRPVSTSFSYALVLFDHEGCGQEQYPPAQVGNEVKQRLEQGGWAGRAEVIVLVPELEVWVWSRSPHVATSLGWQGRQEELQAWLASKGLWAEGADKPSPPKYAMLAALRQARKPPSSALYQELAQKVSLQGQNEPAFLQLVQALQRWFPQ